LAASLVWWLADFGADREPDRPQHKAADDPAAEAARRDTLRKAENQYQLGVIAAEKGDTEEAMLLFAEAAQLNPQHPLANESLGILLQEQGQFQEAVERLRRDLQTDPDQPRTHYFLGLCYGKMSELAEAIKEYRLAVQGAPKFVPARYNLGASLMLLGRNDEAIEVFEETLKVVSELEDPAIRRARRAATLKGLADALLRRGKLEEASKRVQEALSENPELAGAFSLRGEIALAQGRPDQARADFSKALELNPNDDRTRELLAGMGAGLEQSAKEKNGRAAESAVARCQAVVDSDPRSADARVDLGLALIQAGQLEGARKQFEEALRLAPKHFAGCFNLAGLYQIQGELEQAERFYRRALELDPANLEAHRRLVMVLADAGKPAQAVAAAGKGLKHHADDPFLLQERAWILATCADGQIRDGQAALSAALHLREVWEQAGSPAKQGPRVLDVIAAALAENGRFDEAIATAQQGAELARAQGKRGLAERIEARLHLYRQKQPFRSEH
jgi:tetratricopeptide (TPR) repeat protein